MGKKVFHFILEVRWKGNLNMWYEDSARNNFTNYIFNLTMVATVSFGVQMTSCEKNVQSPARFFVALYMSVCILMWKQFSRSTKPFSWRTMFWWTTAALNFHHHQTKNHIHNFVFFTRKIYKTYGCTIGKWIFWVEFILDMLRQSISILTWEPLNFVHADEKKNGREIFHIFACHRIEVQEVVMVVSFTTSFYPKKWNWRRRGSQLNLNVLMCYDETIWREQKQ